jgi:hypothetical protein
MCWRRPRLEEGSTATDDDDNILCNQNVCRNIEEKAHGARKVGRHSLTKPRKEGMKKE